MTATEGSLRRHDDAGMAQHPVAQAVASLDFAHDGAGSGALGGRHLHHRLMQVGVELVYQNFSNALEKLGVEYIEAVGHPFDEHLHEALKMSLMS